MCSLRLSNCANTIRTVIKCLEKLDQTPDYVTLIRFRFFPVHYASVYHDFRYLVVMNDVDLKLGMTWKP
jgi:hypothetical protein